MTPFFMLRIWLRRAPAANKVAAAVALVSAIALLVWIAVPGSTPSEAALPPGLLPSGATPSSAPGTQPGGLPSSGSGAVVPGATGPGGGTGLSGNGQPGSVPTGGVLPPGVKPELHGSGITGCTSMGTPMKIGVILPNVGTGGASGNAALGVPSLDKQKAYYNAAFDDANKHGGGQCRPLQPSYHDFNELDSSNARTICLQFKEEKVFAVVGGFLPGAPDTCLLQNKIPTIEQIMLSTADAKKYYPYYMSTNGAFEVLIKNFVYAVAGLGEFSSAKGFKKLGVLLRSCIPSEMPALYSALAAKGVPKSKVDVFDFGCSGGAVSDPPNQISQAEFQFWRDGVTHVTAIDASVDLQQFTNDANSQYSAQHWKPKYIVPDDGSFATISAAQNRPNGNQFNGAIGITALQYGGIEAHLPESAATKRCDAIMLAHGQPKVYDTPVQFAGSSCALVWMLQAAMNNDPGLSKEGLAPALQRVGSIELSYPDGPNDFRAPGITWGGQYWRQDVYYANCSCFKAVSAPFHKPF